MSNTQKGSLKGKILKAPLKHWEIQLLFLQLFKQNSN